MIQPNRHVVSFVFVTILLDAMSFGLIMPVLPRLIEEVGQMTLGQAAEAFNRYNHKRLRIVDQATAELRIGGSFEVGNVEAFARLLQQGFGLTVRDGRDEILVSR